MGSGPGAAKVAASPAGHAPADHARPNGARGADVSVDPRSFGGRAAAPMLVLALQRSAGNAAVTSLVRRSLDVQRKTKSAGAAAPWNASTRPVLRIGDGPKPDVAQLQQALNTAVPAGKPLRITGMFDADTEAKVKAFQATINVTANGVADKRTWWNLEKKAPRVTRQGSRTTLGPDAGEARGTPDAGTTHPTIKMGAKGPAVEELQQKLNTVPPGQVSIWLSTHGKFDKTTKIAVVEFQKSRTPPLEAKGVVGKGTWAALDAVAGPVTVGRESYRWGQRAEGTITGSDTRFTWRLLPDRLQVTVNIKFTGHSKHPMVAKWRNDIATVWNAFKFVDKSKPGKNLLLDFVVGSGAPVDATVKVHKTPKNAKKIPRSDAANFHTGDTDPGLAPHEFGHLIGLQDEYNKGPEAYTVVTGEQPSFGELDAPTNKKGEDVPPETIAKEMRKAVTGPAASRGKRAAKVVAKYGLVQGGFAQRVALAYEKAYAGKLLREDHNDKKGYHVVNDPAGTMGNDLAARIPGSFSDAPDEWDVLVPFLYSNRGIMGTMDELSSPSGIDPHDHPVAERHVRHFLQIVQSNKPGNWKTARR
jgi:peptidoglycan hydrolase-like protein with peptidoglycan-binding domain